MCGGEFSYWSIWFESSIKIFPIENIPLFKNPRSETEHSWMLPGKPSWGCCVLSQPGTLLGTRVCRLKISHGTHVQTEIPDMAEDGCLTWRESQGVWGGVLVFNGWGTHPFLQKCFTTIWTWAIRSLMHMLHVNQGRCWHQMCQNYSGSKISLLWFQAVFLHEQNVLLL